MSLAGRITFCSLLLSTAWAPTGAWARVERDDPAFGRDLLSVLMDQGPPRTPPLLGCGLAQYGATVLREDFCNHTYDFICGPQNETGVRRDHLLGEEFGRARDEANHAVAAAFGFRPENDAAYEAYAKKNPGKRDAMDTLFVKTVRTHVLNDLDADSLDTLTFDEHKIRRLMIAAIDAQPGLSEKAKGRMKVLADQLVPVDAGKLLSGEIDDPDLKAKVLRSCHRNGLADNAFQPPGTHYVVFCPGALLLMKSDSGLPNLFGDFQGIAGTMAHESGHSCDYENFPVELESLRSCVQANYPELASKVAPSSPLKEGYMEEIAADNWGAETLAQVASTIQDPLDAFRFVRFALRTFCGYPDDGERHPGDRFRVEVLFGKNPRLRQAMGCLPNLESSPGCAIEGAVPAAGGARDRH